MKTPQAWPPPPHSPPPSSAPPPRSPAPGRGALILALGIGSIAGACLLLPLTWLLWSLAYGLSADPGFFVVIYLLTICGVICSGPAAWVLGNEARAGGPLPPQQARQVSSGRVCGMIGLALLGVEILVCVSLLFFF